MRRAAWIRRANRQRQLGVSCHAVRVRSSRRGGHLQLDRVASTDALDSVACTSVRDPHPPADVEHEVAETVSMNGGNEPRGRLFVRRRSTVTSTPSAAGKGCHENGGEDDARSHLVSKSAPGSVENQARRGIVEA